MKLKTRLFLRGIGLLHNYVSLRSKASRAKRMPEYYSLAEKCKIFRTNASSILKHFGIKINVKGFDNIPDGPCLLIPNHSTYLDPLIIASSLSNQGDGKKLSKKFAFIARSEVARKKSVKAIADLINTYYLDFSKPREILNTLLDFGAYVKNNKVSGIIFAEGTRTKDGKLGEFNSGAFKLAQASYLPIVPVTINNACNAMDKNRDAKLNIDVVFHQQIKPIVFQTLDSKDLAEHVKNIIASEYKDQKITSDETIKNKFTKKVNNKE